MTATPNTPTLDPETIAAELPERQREMLIQIYGKSPVSPRNGATRLALENRGLITVTDRDGWDITLTGLGEQVASEINFLQILGREDAPAVQNDLHVPAPDPLADMDIDDLRVLVQQLQADLKAKTAEITDVRGQNVTLKRERDDFDRIGKDAVGKKAHAERDRDASNKQVESLTGQLDTARRRADQVEREAAASRKAEIEAKASAAEALLRAEFAGKRLAALTAPKPDGYIIARDITEAELDALTGEGRKVTHFQFMPDGTLNAVIEPTRHQPQNRYPRNQSAYTPSGLPIPPLGRPTVPPMPSSNAPRPVAAPAGQHRDPCRALMVIPTPRPDAGQPKRIPTFSEILAARTSGKISADDFTKYANALAGYNAAKHMEAVHA